MAELMQVTTTTETQADAETIADSLVRRRLAACVQILGPIKSYYWWQDNLEQSGEWLCIAKTTRDRYEALEQAIIELHPYDVPEILAVPVVQGSQAYLDWMERELTEKEE